MHISSGVLSGSFLAKANALDHFVEIVTHEFS